MNTATRHHPGSRRAARLILDRPASSRHASRNFFIPGLGACVVARAVYSGRSVGEACTSRGITYIVPCAMPQKFSHENTFCYSGPRPYFFYVIKES